MKLPELRFVFGHYADLQLTSLEVHWQDRGQTGNGQLERQEGKWRENPSVRTLKRIFGQSENRVEVHRLTRCTEERRAKGKCCFRCDLLQHRCIASHSKGFNSFEECWLILWHWVIFQAWFSLHLVNWPDSNIMNKIMVYTCFYSVLRWPLVFRFLKAKPDLTFKPL